MTSQIRVLLFDLGGVLFRLNTPARTFDLEQSEEDFLQQWIHSESVRRFEQGTVDATTFAASIVKELRLPYGVDDFLRRFKAWPDKLYPGTPELLDSIPRHYSKALLSNTNALHWHRDDVAGALEHRFDNVFLSFMTGYLKPDTEAFRHAMESCACVPEEIAFFDDNPVNVAAAAGFGCHAFLTRGIGELRSTLNTLRITH
ncbi:MAG: HAD family hydrolase [Woeseiaceae bacterium]